MGERRVEGPFVLRVSVKIQLERGVRYALGASLKSMAFSEFARCFVNGGIRQSVLGALSV